MNQGKKDKADIGRVKLEWEKPSLVHLNMATAEGDTCILGIRPADAGYGNCYAGGIPGYVHSPSMCGIRG